MDITCNIENQELQDFVLVVTKFFAKELRLNRFRQQVSIQSIDGYSKDHDGACGGVCRDGDLIEIALDSALGAQDIVLTLSHEISHVRQFASGQLRYEDDVPYWCGRRADHFQYEDRPWEKIAYRHMDSLITQFTQIF